MNELYSEWLVKRKVPTYAYVVIPLAVVVAIMAFMVCCMYIPYVGYLVGLAPFVGIYFWYRSFKLEYEYVFVTNELSIDKIVAQSKRKRIKTLEMASVEMITDIDSHRLDGQMGNSNIKKVDYTSMTPDAKKYGILYPEGGQQTIYLVEANARMLHAMKQCSPQKVMIDDRLSMK